MRYLAQDWRKVYVIPIHKKGNISDPKNYILVSLTLIVCKTIEHVLSSQIMYHACMLIRALSVKLSLDLDRNIHVKPNSY